MKISIVAAGLLLAALALPSPTARAQAAEWKVGLASVKITPEQPIFMSGYASRTKPFESVAADLYAKALVLEDAQGHRAALVTSDILGFPAAVAEPICQRIAEKTGLTRGQILLNSAHTHTGPLIGVDDAKRDNVPAAEVEKVVAYTRQLQDRVVDAVVRANAQLAPAKLSWGAGVAHFVMNRREFTPNGVILGVNPRGLADRTVPVLRIDAPDGKVRGILYGAATHNTTLGGDCYEICGDYAGFSQAALQEQFPGAQAMFMLGCAGDSNPYPRGKMEISREHGANLAKEVARVLAGRLQPVRGPLRTAFARVEVPLQPVPARAALEEEGKGKSAQAWVARQLLAMLNEGKTPPKSYPCPVAVWQFGEDLTMVGLSGEVVVDYVTMLEKALGPNRLWVAGYCNDVFGYLPSARVLEEGGYECRGLYAGGIGYFTPDAEKLLVRKVRELAAQVGREVRKGQ